MAEHLYRHFDADGKLLYVGISLSAIKRLGEHAANSHWYCSIRTVTIEHFDTREQAIAAETAAIKNERPAHNIMKRWVEPKEIPAEFRRAVESRDALVRRLVSFNPMYSIQDAATALGTSPGAIKRAIEGGALSCIVGPYGGASFRRFISGWQLIDYIEHLQQQSSKAA